LSALLLAATTLIAATPAAADFTVFDRIVAVVDGTPISVGALRRRTEWYSRKLQGSGAPAWQKTIWLRAQMGKELEWAIDDILVTRAAEALGVKADEAAVDRWMDDDAKARRLSRSEFLSDAWEGGYSEADLRATYRRALIEGYALMEAYARTHDDALPWGNDEPALAARAAWRSEWLASLRRRACIERRFVP
jgi:hypothetical protein